MSSKLIVVGRFNYKPELTPVAEITRWWYCRDEADAQIIVRNHMQKTGALGVKCAVTTEEDFHETTRNANGQ